LATLVRAPKLNMVSRLFQISGLAIFPFKRVIYEDSGGLVAAITHGLPTIATRGISTSKSFEEDYGVETVALETIYFLYHESVHLCTHQRPNKK